MTRQFGGGRQLWLYSWRSVIIPSIVLLGLSLWLGFVPFLLDLDLLVAYSVVVFLAQWFSVSLVATVGAVLVAVVCAVPILRGLGMVVLLDEVVREISNTSHQLIIEFVAPGDEMVRSLMSERDIERPDYSIASFKALLTRFGLATLERSSVTSTRTLYLLRKGK